MTTITLPPELADYYTSKAQELGTTPERLVLDRLHKDVTAAGEDRPRPFEPQDEWERRLLGIGIDCGVSLSNEAVSSEGLYE